jgi:hypothetical protein
VLHGWHPTKEAAMRLTVPAVALHLALAALACHEYWSTGPARPAMGVAVADSAASDSMSMVEPDSLTLDQIDLVWRAVDSLMLAIQKNGSDARLMWKLAELYLEHGWDAQALQPLARALELDPASATLRQMLDLAMQRLAVDEVDLDTLAREFRESVEMWGHGC